LGRGRIIFWTLFLTAAAYCAAISYHKRTEAEDQLKGEAVAAQGDAAHIQQTVVLFTERALPAGLPFGAMLQGFGISPVKVAQVIASAQPVFDLRHLRAGNEVSIGRSVLGDLREVRYRIDADHLLSIAPAGEEFHSEIHTIPSRVETASVSGQVDDSLFQAVLDAGEKPELAMRLADIFAWDLDFYTDLRPGDTFRAVVEKKVLADGEAISYGRVVAAEYVNGGHAYQAVLFHDESGNAAYFQPDGKAMKKAFLHSPLKFAAPITSHFSLHRFHPILKEYRAHLGIDYGAPIGTPVQTIGDGRVIFAGYKGGDGNIVKVQHSNGYITYYLHLSRILVRNGQHLGQGDRVGLVGMTGLATGPHLDFRIELRGQFLNFERLKLPTSDPVSKRDWEAFITLRDKALAQMPVTQPNGATLVVNMPPAH